MTVTEGAGREYLHGKTHWLRWVFLLVILLLAVGVRFYSLSKPDIWFDEAFSIMLSAKPPEVIWLLAGRDVHPPLYYMVLHEWMEVFGDSVSAMRSLSALAGVVSVVLGMWLAYLVGSVRVAIVSGLLLALFPIAVRYSQEIRMYSMLWVWLIGATIALIYWIRNPASHASLVIYALLIAAGFYTHYFTGLCVLGHWFYLALLRMTPFGGHGYITRKAWWIANIVIVLLYLPWLPILLTQLKRMEVLEWIAPLTLKSMPSLIWSFFNIDAGHKFPFLVYLSFPLAVFIAMFSVVIKDRTKFRLHTLVVVYVALPIVVAFFISLIKPILIERYLAFAALGLPIVLAIVLAQLSRYKLYLAIFILLSLIMVELFGSFQRVAERQIKVLAEYVEVHSGFGDVIVASGLFFYYPFNYYNTSGIAPLVYPDPRAKGPSGCPSPYIGGSLVYENRDEIYLYDLGSAAPSSGRVWWLSGTNAKVPDYIQDNWKELDRITAGNTQLRLYTIRKPDNTPTRRIDSKICSRL